MDLTTFIQIGIVGICTGFGSAIGNYFAQKSFIRYLEKIIAEQQGVKK